MTVFKRDFPGFPPGFVCDIHKFFWIMPRTDRAIIVIKIYGSYINISFLKKISSMSFVGDRSYIYIYIALVNFLYKKVRKSANKDFDKY